MIPLREPLTLQQTGSYLLLFPSLLSAKLYQEHLIHVHRTARTHTPTSIESPLPPPPGYRLADGEDIYQLLQEYALVPPSQRLSLRLLTPPYSPTVKGLLERGGYEEIVQDQRPNTGRGAETETNVASDTTAIEAAENRRGHNTAVLFWVEGTQPSTFSLKHAIARDGRDRGLAWSIAVSNPPALPGSTVMSSDAIRTSATALAITKLASPSSGTIFTSATSLAPQNEFGQEDDDDVDADDHAQESPRRAGRWVIRFDDEAEARRFVRAWNRRPWPLHGMDGGVVYRDEAPVVGAEVLW